MLNHVVVAGRLCRDVEVRKLPSGKSVANVSVACDRDFTSKETGERETDFIDIVAFGSTADFFSKYFTKGSVAIVSGRLQIRNYTDKDGNKRRAAEVVADSVYFGDSKKSNEGNSTYQAPNSYQGSTGDFSETMAMIDKYSAQGAQQSEFAMLEDDDAQLPF